ncbi:MAG: class I SAM-dependent methyltransferase [Nocardioidaceae bacterium]
MQDREADARRIAAAHAETAPVGWFEHLYQAAERDGAVIPWDRGDPSQLVEEYLWAHPAPATRRRALVVGAGLGRDAELLGALGWEATAFDVSPAAVRMTRARFPTTPVDYVVADLLEPPAEWREAFDLVVESMTVQSLPEQLRPMATRAVGSFVGVGGLLLVVAAARLDPTEAPGPPWPLTRAQVEAFAQEGIAVRTIELIPDAAEPAVHRWRAVFTRTGSA